VSFNPFAGKLDRRAAAAQARRLQDDTHHQAGE